MPDKQALLLLAIGLSTLVVECKASSRWQYNCTGELLTISCVITDVDYTISITDADYGVYDDRSSIAPTCSSPDLEEDCLISVEDINPEDYQKIIDNCDGKTSCSVIAPSESTTTHCAINYSDYIIIYYDCIDDDGEKVTPPAPPTTTDIATTTEPSTPSSIEEGDDDDEDDDTNIGLIIGVVLGIILLIVIVVIIIYLIYRYSRIKSPAPHVTIERNYTYERNPGVEEWHTPPPSKRLSIAPAYDNKAYEDELIVKGQNTANGNHHPYENVGGGATALSNGNVTTVSSDRESAYQIPGNRQSVASTASVYTTLSDTSSLPTKPPINDDVNKRASVASNSSLASSVGGRSLPDGVSVPKQSSVAKNTIPEEEEGTDTALETVVTKKPTSKETAQSKRDSNDTNQEYETVEQQTKPVKPTRKSRLKNGSQGNLSRLSLASVGQSYETIGSQSPSVASEATVGHYEDVQVKT